MRVVVYVRNLIRVHNEMWTASINPTIDLLWCQHQSGFIFRAWWPFTYHYSDVIMSMMASEIISLTIVYSTLYIGADKKHQSSATMPFVRGIHRWQMNSSHKRSVTRICCFHLTSLWYPIVSFFSHGVQSRSAMSIGLIISFQIMHLKISSSKCIFEDLYTPSYWRNQC